MWRTRLVDASVEGRLELVVLLALELLDGPVSKWHPYLSTLPILDALASPPSLWASLRCAPASGLLAHTSIGGALQDDERDLAAILDEQVRACEPPVTSKVNA